MPVRWYVGHLRTGRITAALPLVDGTWTLTLDDAGTLAGSLKLGDPEVAALRPRSLCAPATMFLAAAWYDPDTPDDETFIEAGPIWSHSYSDTTRTLTIGAAGIWSYYDHRKVLPVLTAGQTAADVASVTSDATLGTIARRLVALAHTHTNGSLPVVLPADVAGTETRTFLGSELSVVGEQLRALTEIDGGPEISFVPRRSTGDPRNLEWVMRVGSTAQPLLTQAGLDWVWDASVPGSGVSGIDVAVDGTALASRAWSPGTGAGGDRLIGSADDTTLTAAGYPLLEVEDSTRADGVTAADLNRYAAALVRRSRTAPESWTVKVQAGKAGPTPALVRPGEWAQVVVGDTHPYLDAGAQRGRLTQVSGDTLGNATLSFQLEIV